MLEELVSEDKVSEPGSTHQMHAHEMLEELVSEGKASETGPMNQMQAQWQEPLLGMMTGGPSLRALIASSDCGSQSGKRSPARSPHPENNQENSPCTAFLSKCPGRGNDEKGVKCTLSRLTILLALSLSFDIWSSQLTNRSNFLSMVSQTSAFQCEYGN